VPFIIRAPWALPEGVVNNNPASLIDIIPTLCEMTGAQQSSHLEGESLILSINGKGDANRIVFSEFYQGGSVLWPGKYNPIRMGANSQYKYIYTHATADQLYLRDPKGEVDLNNLAFDLRNEAIVSQMKLCTLDHWELDEFPQLSASALVSAESVLLQWQSAGEGATYDVYRSASADPRKALRVAKALTETSYTDESAMRGKDYTFWVLGHPCITETFTDPRGKSRFGAEPVSAKDYVYRLPITPRMRVQVRDGWAADFQYRALLPVAFSGLSWIHIGKAPAVSGDTVRVNGPLTILSSHAQSDVFEFAAEIRTDRPGSKSDETLKLIFNYQSMDRYYMVGLTREGKLMLWKRSGEWKVEKLATAEGAPSNIKDWQRLAVEKEKNTTRVYLDGKLVINYKDKKPLLGGRVGFETPRNVTRAEIREVSLKA